MRRKEHLATAIVRDAETGKYIGKVYFYSVAQIEDYRDWCVENHTMIPDIRWRDGSQVNVGKE